MANLSRSLLCVFALTAGSWSLCSNAAPVHVEVIVFANHSPSSIDGEWFASPANEIRIEIDQALDGSVDEIDDITQEPNPDHPKPVPTSVLENIADALDSHPDLELLNYFAFVLEPIRKSKTKSVEINVEHPAVSIVPQYLLSGYVSLYEVQALLNLEFNAMYKPNPDTATDTVYLPDTLTRYRVKQEFTINEIRQAQINDIHYFDHPHFGAIVTLVRPETLTNFVQ